MSDLTNRITSDVSGKFLGASDFSVEATLVFGSEEKTISILFEENYAGADQYGVEVGNSGPAAICATAEVENAAAEIPGENEDVATLRINEVTYNVTKAARFGDTAILTLSKD